MASNTKLKEHQKEGLRAMRAIAEREGIVVQHFPQFGVTIASLNKGNTSWVSTALMSDDEMKYRKKVGEYHALKRLMNDGQFIIVRSDFDYYAMAESIGLPV